MLRNMTDLEHYAIRATDGPIGHVQDLYFDDHTWVVRFLVVETGTWFAHRKVLISPIAIGRPNWTEKWLPISMTKEQVRNSPEIDTEKPVSRQHEMQLLEYYGLPYYWGGAGIWGDGTYPNMLHPNYHGMVSAPEALRAESERTVARARPAQRNTDDPHLRDCKVVMNYHVQATDGDIGHVEGMLVDEETWAIRYLVVNTSNWWLGHQVLVATDWIEDISWQDATVSVNFTQQAVKDAPPYDAATLPDRDQEVSIYDHYHRPGYWSPEERRDANLSRY
jgi:uncharacterized protein YrrD